MNRTQKKCIIVSASFHALLVLVLVFGSALMPKKEEDTSFKRINVFSADAVSMILATQSEASGDSAVVDPAHNDATSPSSAPVTKPVAETAESKPPVEPTEAKPVEPKPVEPKPAPPTVHQTPPTPKLPKPEVVRNTHQAFGYSRQTQTCKARFCQTAQAFN